MTNWTPKFIHLPLSPMAGCPWNILDYRGFRIAFCGTDGNHEKDGEIIANDLLNIVAQWEAMNEVWQQSHEKAMNERRNIAENILLLAEACKANLPKDGYTMLKEVARAVKENEL